MLQSICRLVFRLSQDANYNKNNLVEQIECLNNLVTLNIDEEVIINYIKRLICVNNNFSEDLKDSLNYYSNIRKKISKEILEELIKILKEKYGNKFDDIFSQIDIEHMYNC